MTTPTERSSSSSPDSPPGEEASTRLSGSAVSGPTAPAPVPGVQVALASVTWRGFSRSPPGYERSSSATSSVPTVEPVSLAPLEVRTSSSCQPMRPA